MEITQRKIISAKITFTQEEEKTITNFLQMVKEYSDKCDTLRKFCSECPLYSLCNAGIKSVEELKEQLEVKE